jgi:NitT/TauT family transport system substrate-binding protein
MNIRHSASVRSRAAFLAGGAGATAGFVLPRASVAATLAPLSPTVPIRLGVIDALFDAGSLIALARGYFNEEGLDVQLQTFPGSAESNQAIAIGAVDVVCSGPTPMIFNARTMNIKVDVVCGAGQHSVGHGTISVLLRRDLVESGRYKTPADLKGMKIVAGFRTASEWLVQEVASGAGLPDKSIEILSLGFANTVAALSNKAADGASVNEPIATLLTKRADAVRVVTMDKVKPNFPAGYLTFGPLLTATNREAGRRYVYAYMRGLRDYQLAFGPQRRDQYGVLGILKSNNMEVAPETPSLGLTAENAPSLVSIDDFARWQLRQGTIKQLPKMAEIIDDSFRQAALTRLGAK